MSLCLFQYANNSEFSPFRLKKAVNYAKRFESPNGGFTTKNLSKLYQFKMTPGMMLNLDLDNSGKIDLEEASVGLLFEDRMTNTRPGETIPADLTSGLSNIFQQGLDNGPSGIQTNQEILRNLESQVDASGQLTYSVLKDESSDPHGLLPGWGTDISIFNGQGKTGVAALQSRVDYLTGHADESIFNFTANDLKKACTTLDQLCAPSGLDYCNKAQVTTDLKQKAFLEYEFPI